MCTFKFEKHGCTGLQPREVQQARCLSFKAAETFRKERELLPEATVGNKDTCPMSRSQVQRDVGERAVGIRVPSGDGWVSLRAGIDVSM